MKYTYRDTDHITIEMTFGEMQTIRFALAEHVTRLAQEVRFHRRMKHECTASVARNARETDRASKALEKTVLAWSRRPMSKRRP
jgi:K+/H+ antiporter YhaU regulatory subunit KhtT